MKQLLLMRHGEAEAAFGADGDFDRPLTPRGRDQARKAAARLRRARACPDLALSSPALRARESATLVASGLGCLSALHFEPQCYPGAPEALLQLIGQTDAGIGTLLLVGHNPGLSALARRLAALRPQAGTNAEPGTSAEAWELRTGDLCRIASSAASWSELETTGVTGVSVLR
jgi:phosphohistidine phosphatase